MINDEDTRAVVHMVDEASVELGVSIKALRRLTHLIVTEQLLNDDETFDVDAFVAFTNGIVSSMTKAHESATSAWRLLVAADSGMPF